MRFNLKMPEELKQLHKKYENSKVGRELLKLTGISREQLDIFSFFDKYFNSDLVDITIDPNGNIGNNKSNSNLIAEASNSIFKLAALVDMFNYLQKIGYSKEKAISVIDKVISGALYAHDQTKWSTVPYCIAVSSYPLMIEGRPYGQLHSLPPKRPDSFMAQVIEYVMDLSQEFAGAVAIGDSAVNYAYYVANSKISDKQIENDYQKFVHVVNNNFRINAQSPFTNISFFDEPTLKQVFKDYRYPDGSSPLDEPYLSTIKKVQKIWMEFVARKDPKTGFPYRFPVHTVNITVDNENKVIDRDFFDLYCSLNKEGIFNVYIVNDGNARIASCCRLIQSITDLMEYKGIDSFGNGGLNIGAARVVTINLPRVALEAKQLAKKSSKKYGIIVEKLVRTILITRIIQAGALLVSHRELLKDRINQGFLKFFKPLGWLDLDRMFFSTVGLVGIYEFAELLGYDLTTKEGIDFIKDILILINDKVRELSQKWGVPFNVEQIPGETAAITLAKKDKLLYDTDYTLYSNQFIPLWKDILLTERIEIDGILDEYFGGGVISHLNVGKMLSTYHVKRITEYAIEKGLRHFALNLVFSRCKNGHVVNNDIDVCPTCGSTEITKLTRIVGYFVPINNWVKERREWEFKNRVWQ